jgi:hypothetical protein
VKTGALAGARFFLNTPATLARQRRVNRKGLNVTTHIRAPDVAQAVSDLNLKSLVSSARSQRTFGPALARLPLGPICRKAIALMQEAHKRAAERSAKIGCAP